MSIYPNYDYDLIVIGGGSSGLACAKRASDMGAKVLVVDYVKPTPRGTTWGLGGTCMNVGCLPKKLMQQAALLGEYIHDAVSYGYEIPNETDITLNWGTMIEEIQNQIKATNWSLKVELRAKKIEYLNGVGSFVNDHSIKVTMMDGTETQHTANYIVIATGVRPIYPDIPGAREYGITSDDIFSWRTPPGKTLLVGAGYIGLEMGGILRTLGFDVTIMARRMTLNNFDIQMNQILMASLKERGLKFLIPCQPISVEKQTNDRLLIKYKNLEGSKEEVDVFDTIIWAIGRKGDLDDLNIDAIRIVVDNGFILVDEAERTRLGNIYAVGDITKGRPNLSPVAIKAGRYLAQRLFSHSNQSLNYINIPSTLFTPLEYGFVGMTEKAAIKEYGEENIEVYHSYYNPLEFSLPEKVIDFCYIKIIAERGSRNIIVGMHFVGPKAGEVIQGFSVALNCGMDIATLFQTVGVNVTNAQEITRACITKHSGLDPSVRLI